MTRYIMLDFDGVINTKTRVKGQLFDPAAMARLNRIIAATNAKIVVTSGWRIGQTVEALQAFLNTQGLVGEVIGRTTDFTTQDDAGGCVLGDKRREDEIQAWLEEHKPEAFVILDDWVLDDPECPWIAARLVLTDTDTGLLDKHVERAITILGTPWKE